MDDSDLSPAAGSAQDIPMGIPESSETIKDVAFSVLYQQFLPTLVAFLMWQGARLPDAAEIAQDTMSELYKRWSEIRQPKAWARRVASRMLVRRIASVEDPIDEVPECTTLLRPLTNVEEWEQRQDVVRMINRLPSRQRQVMAWTLAGCTPSEIASELRITPEAVRASLKKARLALVAYMQLGANDE